MSLVVLERNVRGIYGKRKYLKPLAMATQADRVRKGYTPNDPLLRDGRLLRDNVQAYTDEGVTTSGDIDKIKIGVGTHEIINAYHEHGYVNARTGRPVPPRPVFRIGAEMSEQEIMRIVKNGIKEAL
jgi:phage gpG-like protein